MIRTKPFALAVAFATCFAFSSASAQDKPAHSHEKESHHGHAEAGHHHGDLPTFGVAIVTPTKGNKVRGVLQLKQVGDDLKVMGKVRNLTPGKHGFHIHEFGDFRDGAKGTSAGGHFNPAGVDHGPEGHGHVGDLGNITANDEGVATIKTTLKNTKLHFVLGRSFVIHADADDLKSQPSGNAGPRVGLGIIGIGNAEYKPAAKK
ncbi:Superoxide dismutase [Cu-Zn] precursor [Roseimaritima multifibrata]|uniref:Superoxide dismutase [Cu-Zn] n=1 Tax=Roseimaritima multifibrata TaxID=1930274 RepID=A0A517MJ33_9BACT|nr:superoxide dismutase family protein [Roseimaritima multifibrata]QDS94909.1 Superoxide dismutase [Cu-Zn] precursor [Roseimaritima multifibrata]